MPGCMRALVDCVLNSSLEDGDLWPAAVIATYTPPSVRFGVTPQAANTNRHNQVDTYVQDGFDAL